MDHGRYQELGLQMEKEWSVIALFIFYLNASILIHQERLWSYMYLGEFSSITKEMLSENRSDLLTEALLHYGNSINMKISSQEITFFLSS